MDIATLDRVINRLEELLVNEGSTPSQFKAGLKYAQTEIRQIKQLAASALTLEAMKDTVTEVPLQAGVADLTNCIRIVTQEDGAVVAVTLVDDDDKIHKVLWERPDQVNEVPEPPGRFHIHPTSDGWFEVCDTATKIEGHPLGEVVGRFKRRDHAWAALLGLNLEAMTRRKVEYLMATPKARPVGVILVLPNLSRAYVDMGRIEWNSVPAHNPMSIKKKGSDDHA